MACESFMKKPSASEAPPPAALPIAPAISMIVGPRRRARHARSAGGRRGVTPRYRSSLERRAELRVPVLAEAGERARGPEGRAGLAVTRLLA